MCRLLIFILGVVKYKFFLIYEEFFFFKLFGFFIKLEFLILIFFEIGKFFIIVKLVELEYDFGLIDFVGLIEVLYLFILIEMIWIGLDFC